MKSSFLNETQSFGTQVDHLNLNLKVSRQSVIVLETEP